MDYYCGRTGRRRRSMLMKWRVVSLLATTLLCILNSRGICMSNGLPISSSATLESDDNNVFQNLEKMKTLAIANVGKRTAGVERRLLGGPGSFPPRCNSKCGRCTPCKPVHVPVPPGTPVTAEYYPEAWRCKCGNKLYMP